VPGLITEPTHSPVPGGKVIDAHIGRVNTGSEAVSLAYMMVPVTWGEPFQRPDFDEVTLVLAGSVFLDHEGAPTSVLAGQPILTSAGERIRDSCGPGGAEYVAVCLPAFAPDTVNRED
jgi:hypothetical protein